MFTNIIPGNIYCSNVLRFQMYIKHALLMNAGRNKRIGRKTEKNFSSLRDCY